MVEVFGKENCPACKMTTRVLEGLSVANVYKTISESRTEQFKSMGYKQLPIVTVDGEVFATGFEPTKLRQLAN